MYTLNYKISHYDQAKQILKVDATLPSNSEDVLKLFKGKVKLLSFECDHPFTESNPYILIEGSNSLFIYPTLYKLAHLVSMASMAQYPSNSLSLPVSKSSYSQPL